MGGRGRKGEPMPDEVKCHKCSKAPGVKPVPGDKGWMVCGRCGLEIDAAVIHHRHIERVKAAKAKGAANAR